MDIEDVVPHFSTFGKNYSRRFRGTDIFEQIFYGILEQCIEAELVDTSEVFIDGTHIKAHANNKKYDYVYDEYYDQYICPTMKILSYTTTNRDGYREYKSNMTDCSQCPLIAYCTESKEKRKLIQRHLWENDMERCEDIRHSLGMKAIYNNRKQTIERLFGTAKEFHGLRYTNLIGKEKMHMKIGLTFACLNIKKLAKMLILTDLKGSIFLSILGILSKIMIRYKKTNQLLFMSNWFVFNRLRQELCVNGKNHSVG